MATVFPVPPFDTLTISIHTTLAGGDAFSAFLVAASISFQSTPPSRVATKLANNSSVFIKISIHTTLAGGDFLLPHLVKNVFIISIHTTLAGGDWDFFFWETVSKSISIHTTLAGGDAGGQTGAAWTKEFQSTPPSRVATNWLDE